MPLWAKTSLINILHLFVFSTIPLDLIPERKPKKKLESSIDEIPCSEACNNDCDCEEEPESGAVSKVSSTNVSPPRVRVEGCTPPSEEEHPLNMKLSGEACPEECEYIHYYFGNYIKRKILIGIKELNNFSN